MDRAGIRSAVLQGFVDGLDADDTVVLAALLEQAQHKRAGATTKGAR